MFPSKADLTQPPNRPSVDLTGCRGGEGLRSRLDGRSWTVLRVSSADATWPGCRLSGQENRREVCAEGLAEHAAPPLAGSVGGDSGQSGQRRSRQLHPRTAPMRKSLAQFERQIRVIAV